MSTWRQYAEQVQRGNEVGANRDIRVDSPKNGPNGPIGPNVPLDPSRAMRSWRTALSRVDACKPPEGWTIARWQLLVDDAAWLLANFGKQAARDGFTTADLFGIWPGVPHAGGIADRLRGSRSVVMDSNRAHWRSWGQVERYNRGSYPDLKPFWEIV